jgi:di/tricarboxylate transporter
MKRGLLIFIFILSFSFFISNTSKAQCSICTKTAQQLGEKPAKGLNSGILYLAFMPLAIFGIIGYRWWRSNKQA